jgi:hypothetical protein
MEKLKKKVERKKEEGRRKRSERGEWREDGRKEAECVLFIKILCTYLV